MAPNDTTNSAEGNEDGGSGGNDADSQAPLSKEEGSIASIICNLIPKFQDQSGGPLMETDEPAGAGGEFNTSILVQVPQLTFIDGTIQGQSSNPTTKPAPLPKELQLSTEFTVKQAQTEKSKIKDAAAKKKVERPVRGMAQKKSIAQHFEPYTRGVQFFIKSFLSGPDKPQVFPHPLPLKRKTHNIGLKSVLSLSSSNWMD
ncbi:hypothetical protein MJO28_016953 [Puccinia striiformis f. sp. tritici]|nr:hypothetical protein MJO28_016953 [Puccinia striiformis f. sp. tritici]